MSNVDYRSGQCYIQDVSHIHLLEPALDTAAIRTIDVRTIVPRERHPLIFGAFDALAPGAAFLIVNDHDPKPLYSQFQAKHNGRFKWEYLESGPDVWKVRIGKTG